MATSTNTDYEEHWLKSFLDEKLRYRKFSDILSTDLIEIIARVSSKFSNSAEIEFTCLINLDEFFQAFYRLQEITIDEQLTSNQVPKVKEADFRKAILSQFAKQVIPFAINVVMICRKYISGRTQVVSIKSFLELSSRITNRSYKLNNFQWSEFQVFQAMDFQILPATAYYAAKYLLEKCSEGLEDKKDICHRISEDLLRVSFFRRNYIYNNLNQDIADIEKFKSDQILLGAAVTINVFTIIQLPVDKIVDIIEKLAEISKISAQEILCLSIKIKDAVQFDENDNGPANERQIGN